MKYANFDTVNIMNRKEAANPVHFEGEEWWINWDTRNPDVSKRPRVHCPGEGVDKCGRLGDLRDKAAAL